MKIPENVLNVIFENWNTFDLCYRNVINGHCYECHISHTDKCFSNQTNEIVKEFNNKDYKTKPRGSLIHHYCHEALEEFTFKQLRKLRNLRKL